MRFIMGENYRSPTNVNVYLNIKNNNNCDIIEWIKMSPSRSL